MGSVYGYGEKKMTSGNYRILEKEFANGDIIYVLEQYNSQKDEWASVFANRNLEIIREAKNKRKNSILVKERVLE